MATTYGAPTTGYIQPMEHVEDGQAKFQPGELAPEEFNARKGAWDSFMETFKNDKDLRMAMFRTGMAMMLPVQPTDTTAGHIGKAVVGGMDWLSAKRTANTTEANAQEKHSAELAKNSAAIDASNAGAVKDTALAEAYRAGIPWKKADNSPLSKPDSATKQAMSRAVALFRTNPEKYKGQAPIPELGGVPAQAYLDATQQIFEEQVVKGNIGGMTMPGENPAVTANNIRGAVAPPVIAPAPAAVPAAPTATAPPAAAGGMKRLVFINGKFVEQ